MSAKKETVGYTVTVAFLVCLVCAIVVSVAAVSLRSTQKLNAELDMKTNILAAASLLEPGKTVEESFEQIETRVINLETGAFADDIDPATFDQRKAAGDPARSQALDDDPAGIIRQEDHSLVYIVRDAQGGVDKVILPIRGYGLWSTLYGFVALESDLNTIAGLGFYEHGETPGLGGEVDNPKWKSQWPGKQVYDDSGVEITVTKAGVAKADNPYQVDGLSGATLTTRGVDNFVKFWLGERGFQPFLQNLAAGEA